MKCLGLVFYYPLPPQRKVGSQPTFQRCVICPTRHSARAGGASPYHDDLRRCIATNSGIAVLASRFSFAVVSYSNDGERMRHPTSCPRSSTMLCSRSAPLSASGCTIVHAATRDMWRAREAHTRLSPTALHAHWLILLDCTELYSSLSNIIHRYLCVHAVLP